MAALATIDEALEMRDLDRFGGEELPESRELMNGSGEVGRVNDHVVGEYQLRMKQQCMFMSRDVRDQKPTVVGQSGITVRGAEISGHIAFSRIGQGDDIGSRALRLERFADSNVSARTYRGPRG